MCVCVYTGVYTCVHVCTRALLNSDKNPLNTYRVHSPSWTQGIWPTVPSLHWNVRVHPQEGRDPWEYIHCCSKHLPHILI